ncbi:hypothetical protein ASE21_19235 [Flavobacterium sp. Root901]|uniref:hypothetical protein n=1 Tax=Flavobacterium sp. Root901 TaxID=1736605 RepID=UPI00070DDE36|nr:hypothetical protein [Flavobacterium sp. Root901]KRD06307.1 hypothetical protein ASE21_19235 [Flavobacterium sp. Root901]
MSTKYNRIKVADLEKNLENKTLVTNVDGELEFKDVNTLIPPADPVSATQSGIVDNTSLQELGGEDKLINNVRIGIGSGTGTGNTVLGMGSLSNSTTGSNNTAIGEEALASNTTGKDNTALGNWALRANTTGTYNNAFGENSLANNTTGSYNTALGYKSLGTNLTSPYNVAVGNSSLAKLISGLGESVAVGAYCMYDATGTDKNVAVGTYSLRYNTSGFSNTALGHSSLTANTAGHSNNAFGNYSLISLTTGYGNVAMGKFAGHYVTTGNFNIYIGSEGSAADAAASGIVNIGNKFVSNADNLASLPSQTNTLIDANTSGKAIVTKEYLLDKLKNNYDQLEISSSQNISSEWLGKTILFTTSCTITVPASLPENFIFNGITLPGVNVTWAITTPHTWLFGTPSPTGEKQIFTFTKRGNTNSILLLGV